MYFHGPPSYHIPHACFECSMNYSHPDDGKIKYLHGRNTGVYSTKNVSVGKVALFHQGLSPYIT